MVLQVLNRCAVELANGVTGGVIEQLKMSGLAPNNATERALRRCVCVLAGSVHLQRVGSMLLALI
jgi:hypothetical protein